MVGVKTLTKRLIETVGMTRYKVVQFVRLCDYTQIEEGIEAHEEMLTTDIEIDDTEPELDVCKRKAVSQNTVRHHTADRVTAA